MVSSSFLIIFLWTPIKKFHEPPLFNTMLVTTDPVIVNFRNKPKKKAIPYNKDIVLFFNEPLKENMDKNDDDCDDELDDSEIQ